MKGRIGVVVVVLSFLVACGKSSEVRQDAEPVEAAYQFLESLEGRHGLTAAREQLVVIENRRDNLEQTHVRFQQVHDGIPVYGSHLIAHLDRDLAGRSVTGRLLEIPANASTRPALDASTAQRIAGSAACAATTDAAELVFYAARGGEPRLAYRVPGRNGLEVCDVFVAADEPRVLGAVSRSPTPSAGE